MLFVILVLAFVGILVGLFVSLQAISAHKRSVHFQGSYPSVTVIRPVKGLDVGAAENFRAALVTGYPGTVETIFIFDDQNDPAYALAGKIVDEYKLHGGKDQIRILLSGAPPQGRTGKLHAMMLGEAEARGELIAFADSDTRPDQNVLRILVETLLTTKKAGASFIPVVVDQPIQRAGDVCYALLQNALYAPFALSAAGTSHTLPFIMGQYMVFTRACLKKIGGVACASGQLVEDMANGKVVHEAGLLNVIAPYSLSIVSSGLSIGDFLPIYQKWLQFGKNGLPSSFLWRQWFMGSFFFIPLLILIPTLLLNQWLLALLSAVDLCLFAFAIVWAHEKFGGSRVPLRYMWVPFVMMLLAPVILFKNRVSKQVTWRGRVYKVNDRAALS